MQTELRPEPVIRTGNGDLTGAGRAEKSREKQRKTLYIERTVVLPSRPARSVSGAGPGPRAARSRLGARERAGDRVDQRGHARPPARGDVVVQAEDVAVLNGRHLPPAWPPGDDRRGLAAVGGLAVGQEDELRPGGDDVLLRQLGVAAVGGLGGRVGDVLQPEQVKDVPDERGRGGGVVRVV